MEPKLADMGMWELITLSFCMDFQGVEGRGDRKLGTIQINTRIRHFTWLSFIRNPNIRTFSVFSGKNK